jgi:hypothetical protein
MNCGFFALAYENLLGIRYLRRGSLLEWRGDIQTKVRFLEKVLAIVS